MNSNDCWLWKGEANNKGYGRIARGGRGNRKRTFAHRDALAATGVDIRGKVVMHTCDNPRCVNPAHLRVGTQAENLADMKTKRRQNLGERNGMAKTTNKAVLSIREHAEHGMKREDIAARHGVSIMVVRDILLCRRWGLVW